VARQVRTTAVRRAVGWGLPRPFRRAKGRRKSKGKGQKAKGKSEDREPARCGMRGYLSETACRLPSRLRLLAMKGSVWAIDAAAGRALANFEFRISLGNSAIGNKNGTRSASSGTGSSQPTACRALHFCHLPFAFCLSFFLCVIPAAVATTPAVFRAGRCSKRAFFPSSRGARW